LSTFSLVPYKLSSSRSCPSSALLRRARSAEPSPEGAGRDRAILLPFPLCSCQGPERSPSSPLPRLPKQSPNGPLPGSFPLVLLVGDRVLPKEPPCR
jgi:hypothetical protein